MTAPSCPVLSSVALSGRGGAFYIAFTSDILMACEYRLRASGSSFGAWTVIHADTRTSHLKSLHQIASGKPYGVQYEYQIRASEDCVYPSAATAYAWVTGPDPVTDGYRVADVPV